MSQQYRYPNSAVVSVNIASEGDIDQPAPGELLQVGGRDPDDDLVPLRFNASGELIVSIASGIDNPLPVTDAAAEASLASIDSKTPALGQALMAASVPVAIASDQSTLPVSAASLPLPAGAATEAKQDTQITELQDIEADIEAMSAKLPATLGQKAMAASLAVVIASDQSTVPVSAASLPLPSGAATEAKQDAQITQETAIAASVASIDSKTPALGQAIMDDSVPVVIASNQSQIDVNINASGITLDVGTTQLPASLGQTNMAGSLSVAIASNQSALPVAASGGRARANAPTYHDYSSGNVTTAAYTELIASTSSAASMLDIFDSSGQAMIIAVGAAASEVDQFYVFPGGNGPVQLAIAAGSRVSVKALTANATSGYLILNLYT